MNAVVVTVLLNAATFAVLYIVLTRRVRRELDAGETLDAIRDEINALVVELNRTTDRNVGIAEERMRTLRKLIDTADRRIQLANRELEKHQIGVDVYNKLKSSAERRPVPDSRARALPTSSAESSGAAEAESLARRVERLSRQGFDARIIAGRLGTTVGEVELILSLRDGRNRSESDQ